MRLESTDEPAGLTAAPAPAGIPRTPDQPAGPYPRRGPVRELRTAVLYCWAIVTVYLGNVVWSLYLSFRSSLSSPHPSVSWSIVRDDLALPGGLGDSSTPLWADGVLLLAFVSLIGACSWATRDLQRERAAEVSARHRAVVSDAQAVAHHEAQVATSDLVEKVAQLRASITSSQPAQAAQAPPFDDIRLPSADHFVGRSAECDWLLKRLQANGPLSVTALSGLPGIGKTALAAKAVKQVRGDGRFPDGIAVVLFEELDEKANAADVLKRVLGRFDPARRPPDTSDPARLAEVAHQLFSGKQALVVLDNVRLGFAIAGVMAPLREAGASVLLTARHQLPDVPVAGSRALVSLNPDEALQLFAESLGRELAPSDDPTHDERGTAERIVKALGYHPYAIKLAGSHAAHAGRDLATLAGELENPQHAIELPDGETPGAVALAFEQSTQDLPPGALRLFVALAAFATNAFGRQSALALGSALHLDQAKANLYQLELRSLIEPYALDAMPPGNARERLRLHPLLLAFAAQQFRRWPAEEQHDAYLAVARFFTAYTASVPTAEQRALAPDVGNIQGALEWAQATGQGDLVAYLCQGMKEFWRVRWLTKATLRYLPWGIAAAEALAHASGAREERLLAAGLALTYGQVLQNIGRLDEAEQAFQTNLVIRRQAQDRRGESQVLVLLGELAYLRGDLPTADDYCHQALERLDGADDRASQADRASALSYLGEIALTRGHLAEADERFVQSLAICTALGDIQGESILLYNRGEIAWHHGQLPDALLYYQESLSRARYEQVQDRRAEAMNLGRLGDIARRQGQLGDAEHDYLTAMKICVETQDEPGQARLLDALGRLAMAQGEREQAETLYQQSLTMANKVQNRRSEGVAQADLGELAAVRGQLVDAEKHYRLSLEQLAALDAIQYTHVLFAYGTFLAEQAHRQEDGCRLLQQAADRFTQMGLPEAAQVHELVERLGCEG
jgi:tetratricopeptide (TPR) repeat protein